MKQEQQASSFVSGDSLPPEVVDPVRGMTISRADAAGSDVYDGRTYHFCSTGCLDNVRADPLRYTQPSTGRPTTPFPTWERRIRGPGNTTSPAR